MSDAAIRVLLIAGDEDELCLYRLGLSSRGMAVTTASTAEEGAFIAGLRLFDAVVLTIVSRREDGWDECIALRAHPSTTALPLVLLSASVRPDRANRDRALHAGCAAFVAKPCLPEHLAEIVKRVVAGERNIEEVTLHV